MTFSVANVAVIEHTYRTFEISAVSYVRRTVFILEFRGVVGTDNPDGMRGIVQT